MTDDKLREVKQRLERYHKLRIGVRAWVERLRLLENLEILPARGASEAVAHDNVNGDAMTATDRRIDFHGMTFPLIEGMKREMQQIAAEVRKLEDPIEREIIMLYYIDDTGWRKRKWPEVAVMLYGDCGEAEMQAVFRGRKHALEHLVKIQEQMSVNVSECQ